MPVKRKRDILDFDPNKSDSSDENFEPGHDGGSPRRSKKKPRGQKSHHATPHRQKQKRDKYRGSEIDSDDEEVSDDVSAESFGSGSDEDSDEQPLTTATGRRARKAAVNHVSYKESSEGEEESAAESMSDDGEETKKKKHTPKKTVPSARPSRIVVLKANPRKLR